MSEKLKEVEKMITEVMKHKDLNRNQAIDYMLIVATGRLRALWRYTESLPEGKATKGILEVKGRKQRAPKTPRIAPLKSETEEKAKSAKAKAKAKPAKKPAKDKPAKKAKPAKKEKRAEQLDLQTAAQELA